MIIIIIIIITGWGDPIVDTRRERIDIIFQSYVSFYFILLIIRERKKELGVSNFHFSLTCVFCDEIQAVNVTQTLKA